MASISPCWISQYPTIFHVCSKIATAGYGHQWQINFFGWVAVFVVHGQTIPFAFGVDSLRRVIRDFRKQGQP